MDNLDNPFITTIKLMRQNGEINNPTPFFIGEVISASPLLIQVGDIQLEREDVLINEMLLSGYERKLELHTTNATGQTASSSGGSGYAEYASHSHSISNIAIKDGTYKTLDDFLKGDKLVLLMSQDQQQFIVLCKVR